MTDTRRPTNPAAEEILGLYFPVLDHGFVSLVDYMGSDEDVERAARVSYGYGTRRSNQTRGLVRYLRRHRHTTPSEMVELKFHCCMPVFVARQWIRHRTACLAEGTRVYFDLPGGISRRGNQLYSLPIEDLYRRFQPTQNVSRPDKQMNAWFRRDRVRQMSVRQMDEDTFMLQRGRIADAFDSGVKPVVRMRLADGKAIECTPDHRFHFSDGWATLASRTGLSLERAVATWKPGDYFVYVNGADAVAPALYTDRTWLDDQYNGRSQDIRDIAEACGASIHTIRKWLHVHGLTNGTRTAHRPTPWNKGGSYRLGARHLSPAWIEANRVSRSGAASNFWKGGVAPQRASIGRWTSQRAHVVHERNGWTCQLCHERSGELHVHHVVPVWADPSLARADHNLTTLCGPCHRNVNGDELAYVERLGGPVVRTEWQRRPRVAWNKLTRAKLVRIEAFEYVGSKRTYDLEIVGPHHNFVANGIVTHNSVNEYSGRYSLLPLLYYRPAPEHLQAQSPSNKQGRAGAPLESLYADVAARWDRLRADASRTYEWLVEQDVAREIARIDLPLSVYTQWYWKIDLHNLLHFLKLRVDPHAQYEIRVFAEVMAGMVQRVAPFSFEAWYDYEFQGAELSRGEMEALRRLIAVDGGALVARGGARVDPAALAELGLSVREVEELQRKLASAPARVDFALDPAAARSADEFAQEMAAAVPRVDRDA